MNHCCLSFHLLLCQIFVHGLDACLSENQLVGMFACFEELSDLSFRANQQYALIGYVNRFPNLKPFTC